jgi:hypothetical protein
LQDTLDLYADILSRPGPLGDADQDFMRLAVVLDDAPLQAHGAERFAHHAKVRRLTETQLQEYPPTKVNPLIHPAAPHDRSHTDEDDDD